MPCGGKPTRTDTSEQGCDENVDEQEQSQEEEEAHRIITTNPCPGPFINEPQIPNANRTRGLRAYSPTSPLALR